MIVRRIYKRWTYDERLVVGSEVVAVNFTSHTGEGGRSTEGGEPIFHSDDTTNCSSVISVEL